MMQRLIFVTVAGLVGALGLMESALALAQTTREAQPGLQWTEDQIRNVALHIRAGRTLTPKSWPGGARVAVCLSFDPDNFSIALNRGNNAPVTISQGEYGALTGTPRILRLLERYGLPSSWYIPAVAAMMHPEMIEAISDSGRRATTSRAGGGPKRS